MKKSVSLPGVQVFLSFDTVVLGKYRSKWYLLMISREQ